MINALRWWRLIFIFFASICGMIGVVIAGILLLTHLSTLETFGVPYLTPFAPLYYQEQNDAILLQENSKIKKRPRYFTTKNKTRLNWEEKS